MYNATRLRILRMRHCITLNELGRYSKLSTQYLSRLELRKVPAGPVAEAHLSEAIEELIRDTRTAADALESDYNKWKGRLCQPMEEETDEL